MLSRYLHLASWLVGAFALVAVVLYFQPFEFFETLKSVGIGGALLWLMLTMVARFLLVEITVIPVKVLGFRLRRADAFWIGWVRSFSNQILPMSGAAFYAYHIRRKAGMAWSQLVSLSSPQFLLSAAAFGLIGALAVACNIEPFGQTATPMMFIYLLIAAGAILVASKSAYFLELLPEAFLPGIRRSSESFRMLAQRPEMMFKLLLYHCVVILIRGGRIWMLFIAAGMELNWQAALLLVAVAETATFVNLTPGGLGLREAAIVAGAALVEIPADVSISVALIDRMFEIATTTSLAAPAFIQLRKRACE